MSCRKGQERVDFSPLVRLLLYFAVIQDLTIPGLSKREPCLDISRKFLKDEKARLFWCDGAHRFAIWVVAMFGDGEVRAESGAPMIPSIQLVRTNLGCWHLVGLDLPTLCWSVASLFAFVITVGPGCHPFVALPHVVNCHVAILLTMSESVSLPLGLERS